MLALSSLCSLVVLALAGCAGTDGSETGKRTVVAAFYPLSWAVESVAGDDVQVVNLTPPGAEPHDVELTPRDIETIRGADLVVFVGGGFQPALEDAVAQRDGPSLDVVGTDETDPHIWLDPERFSSAIEAIAERLGGTASAQDAVRALAELDADYHRGLRACRRRTLVTAHAAFGRLALRYGLTQLALAGISPEAEPGPRRLEQVVDQVRDSGATTIFSEPLVSDRLAVTVAREADVEVAVLDPIEGLADDRLDAGEDYVSVMRSNLAALREALGCT